VHKYRKADWTKVKEAAAELTEKVLDDRDKFNSNPVNTNWELFKNGIRDIVDRLIPKSTIQNQNNLPWVNDHIRKAIRKKQRLFSRMKKNSALRTHYTDQKKKVKKLIYAAHRKHVTELLDSPNSDPSKFWQYIKSKKTDNSGVAPIRSEGKLYSDPKSKAQILNTFFQSVFTRENTSNIPEPSGPSYPSLLDVKVTVDGVRTLLCKLNPRKACGPDQIPNRVLKEAASEIAPLYSQRSSNNL